MKNTKISINIKSKVLYGTVIKENQELCREKNGIRLFVLYWKLKLNRLSVDALPSQILCGT